MQDFKENSLLLLHGVFTQGALAKIKYKGGTRIVICEGRPTLRAGEHNGRYFLDKKAKPVIICDNMAGSLFFNNYVKEVVLACQYADSTGALCDMGALILAVLAKKHKVPLRLLEAEHKKHFLGNPNDLLSLKGLPTAPAKTNAYAPLVEWVPTKYLK